MGNLLSHLGCLLPSPSATAPTPTIIPTSTASTALALLAPTATTPAFSRLLGVGAAFGGAGGAAAGLLGLAEGAVSAFAMAATADDVTALGTL